MNLGKLKKIDLRNAWKNEASDFTNWLAKEQNLGLLSDEIGIDIKLIETEADVGRYSADILAEEENTERKIIIENQLEVTNHAHLGQIITYASGYDADFIIWVVKDVRDEHKQAVDWLNEHTGEKPSFFIIKMELWQIGDSPFAPKFQIISQPNDWAKALKKTRGQFGFSKIQMMQLDFWNKFKEYSLQNKTKLKLRKANPQHWYFISLGNSNMHISLTVNTRDNLLGCEIYLPDSQETYKKLSENKDKIENELQEKLEWQELPNKKASRIKISKKADISNIDEWDECFEWLKKQAESFQNVFSKYK
jgi:hypothetical protein